MTQPCDDVPIRRIFIDVSVICQHDAQTGIQRVVRAVIEQLHRTDTNVEIRYVGATSGVAYREVEYRREGDQQWTSIDGSKPPLSLSAGDMFLGLDFAAHIMPRHARQIARWKSDGARIAIVIFDILPYTNPEWFSRAMQRHFRRWLSCIGRFSDIVLPISHHVEREVGSYLHRNHRSRADRIASHVLPLSGKLPHPQNDVQATCDRNDVLAEMKVRKTLLMVGTIEPRKGHAYVIAAHQRLWGKGHKEAPLLIIVGKPGWKSDRLQQSLMQFDLARDGICWLSSVPDILLWHLYGHAHGVVVASLGEGYCLPLKESLDFNRPVLARDLPVLREFDSDLIQYFQNDGPCELADSIRTFCDFEPAAGNMAIATGWDRTVDVLLKALCARAGSDALAREAGTGIASDF